MTEKKKESRFWKIAAIVLAFPTAFLAYLQAMEHLQPDGPQFVISTQHGPFAVPEGTLTRLDFDLVTPPEEKDQIGLDKLKSYGVVTITNSGNQPANKVRLQTKSKGYAHIEWDDGEIKDIPFTNDVEFHTLEIKKSLTVSFWTIDEITTSTKMSLIHSQGDVPVSFESEGDVWIYWKLTLILASVAAIVVGIGFYRWSKNPIVLMVDRTSGEPIKEGEPFRLTKDYSMVEHHEGGNDDSH